MVWTTCYAYSLIHTLSVSKQAATSSRGQAELGRPSHANPVVGYAHLRRSALAYLPEIPSWALDITRKSTSLCISLYLSLQPCSLELEPVPVVSVNPTALLRTSTLGQLNAHHFPIIYLCILCIPSIFPGSPKGLDRSLFVLPLRRAAPVSLLLLLPVIRRYGSLISCIANSIRHAHLLPLSQLIISFRTACDRRPLQRLPCLKWPSPRRRKGHKLAAHAVSCVCH